MKALSIIDITFLRKDTLVSVSIQPILIKTVKSKITNI